MTLTSIRPAENTRDMLIDRVQQLAPLITRLSDRIDSERRLPEKANRALVEAELYKMWVPRSMGGFELDPVSYMEVLEALARVDGSAGWCLMLSSSFGIFAGYLDEAVAHEIYDDPGAILAGQINANPGRALAVDGGYRVSGRWAFGSNILNSTWVVSGANVYDGDSPRLGPDGQPVPIEVITPRDAVTIQDTWHTIGMRGTGSNDYKMEDVFVPAERSFQLGGELKNPANLYKVPRAWGFPLAAPAVGVAVAALDAMRELTTTHKFRTTGQIWRENALMQYQVAKAESLIESGRSAMYRALETMWAAICAGEAVTPDMERHVSQACPQAVHNATEAVDILFTSGGGGSVYYSNPLARRFLDVHTAGQHTAFGLDRMQRLGQQALGVTTA